MVILVRFSKGNVRTPH